MSAKRSRRINVELLNRLRDVLGGRRVSHAQTDAINYGRDMWPRSLLEIRRGRVPHRPDFIVWPETTDHVSRVLRLCNEMCVPVVPFGAGSGMCGAATPVSGGVILDMKKMNRVEKISEQSNIAVVQPGILGALLERELNAKGYTLGHFPGSLGTSTLGGYLATRSAGMAATYYGGIERILISLQVVLPDGTVVQTRTTPRRATGPDFNHLFLGSEGTLGVITHTHLRIHALPDMYGYRGLAFKKFEDGLKAVRLILRAGLRPAYVRLSDSADTAGPLSEAGLSISGCLLSLVFAGRESLVDLALRKATEIARSARGRDHGEEPARIWYENRFSEFYEQSPWFGQPDTVFDVLEIAAPWKHVPQAYQMVKAAVPKRVTAAGYVSHAYPEGCSLQFMLRGKATPGKDVELYDQMWKKIMPAVQKSGAVISHQHGIGLHKADWWQEQAGPGHALLAGIKRRLDPNNILNPGKFATDTEAPC
ncbi:MAG: FAD-binding oxidoreductase [Candidatus Lernaella stagnicola]|nr:FAD-binding oxidoreductase [Candidatus Lernaella stagnicola]